MTTAPPAPEPTPPPAPTPPAPADPPKTFTQDDVDRIIAERLSRAKATAPADYDEVKKKAAEWDKVQEGQKSELQKAQDKLAEAEQARKAAEDRALAAIRKSAVVAAATKAGAVDPDAVLALLPMDKVTVADDGLVTGVEEAVKVLLEAKPYLVGKPSTPTPGGADGGTRNTVPPGQQLTRDDLKRMSPEQIVEAEAKGQLNDLLGVT